MSTVYTNRLSHSRFYVSWQQAGNKSKTINWQAGIETKDESGYWDNWYNNAMQINNITIDEKTVLNNGVYSNISGGVSRQLASGSVEVSSGSFQISITGYLYNTGTVSKTETVSIDIEPDKPTVSISEVSHTATTIKIKCSDTNEVGSEKYHIYNGDTFLKETTSKEITLENLTPNTRYSIKAYGYGNGGFGPESNTLYITTSKQSTITSIGDFSINGVKLTISGEGNIVVIIDGKEVVRRNKAPAGEYELILTDDEKQEIYKLMGNSNSINAIIRVETSGTYVDKNISITLTGDVFSCTLKINGANKKCKVWVGTTSGNKQGIFTIGTSKGNVRGR